MAIFILPSGAEIDLGGSGPNAVSFVENKANASREIGGTGLHEFSGYVKEEFLNELTGKKGAQYFEQMRRNDPAIGAAYMAISMLMRSSNHSITINVPVSEQKKSHEKAIKFANECIEDMQGRPEDWIEDACTALTHGYSLDEISFKIRDGKDSDYNDGKLGISGISPRHQTSVENWDFDEHFRATGYYHSPQWGSGQVYIPLWKSFHFRTSREHDNPEGYSFLRNSVRAYKQVNVVQYAEGIGAERNLAGLPMVEMPVGATSDADYTRARNLVEKARRDEFAGVVLPPPRAPGEDFRWKFSLISSNNVGTGIDTDKIIRRLHSEMLISMLINFLSFGQGGESGGGYAAGRVQGDFFQVAVSGLLSSWEYEINEKLFKKLFRYNQFPGLKKNEYPVIKFSPISQRNMETVRNLLRDMSSIGFIDNQGTDIENWLRGQLDLPPITKEDLEKRKEEAEIATQKALEHQQELAAIVVPPGTDTAPKDVAGVLGKGKPKAKGTPANPTVKGPAGTKPPRDTSPSSVSAKKKDGPTAGL